MRWPLAALSCIGLGFMTGAAGRWVMGWQEAALAESRAESPAEAMPGEGKRAVGEGKGGGVFKNPGSADRGPRLSVDDLRRLTGTDFTLRLFAWLPDATVEELAKLTRPLNDPEHNAAAEAAIYLRWAELDPQGALKSATANGNASPAWRAWAQVDPEKAVAVAAADGSRWALVHVLSAIAANDPEKARLFGEKYPAAFHSRNVQGALAEAMAANDPRGAAALSYRGASWDAEKYFSQWAHTDPAAAFEWAKALPDRASQFGLMRSLIGQWWTSDPEKAAAAVDGLPPGKLRTQMMTEQAIRMVNADPQAALDFAMNAKNSPQHAMVDRVFSTLASKDPKRVIAALSPLQERDWADLRCLPETFSALARTAGVETLDWMNSPQGALAVASGMDVRRSAFEAWMGSSPKAATAWLAAQPRETRPTDCVQEVIRSLTQGQQADYDAAWQWAAALPDGRSRSATLERVFAPWSNRNPDQAAKALETTLLPEADRGRFSQRIETLRKPR